MRVKVKTLKRFELTSESGIPLGEFVEADTWEGMRKLTNDQGDSIVIESQLPVDTIFQVSDGTEIEAHVIKASPGLMTHVLAEAETTDQPESGEAAGDGQ